MHHNNQSTFESNSKSVNPLKHLAERVHSNINDMKVTFILGESPSQVYLTINNEHTKLSLTS